MEEQPNELPKFEPPRFDPPKFEPPTFSFAPLKQKKQNEEKSPVKIEPIKPEAPKKETSIFTADTKERKVFLIFAAAVTLAFLFQGFSAYIILLAIIAAGYVEFKEK